MRLLTSLIAASVVLSPMAAMAATTAKAGTTKTQAASHQGGRKASHMTAAHRTTPAKKPAASK